MNNIRVGLFIDGGNIYAAARRLGWNVDHRKLLDHFARLGALYNAFYYTAQPVDDKQRRFVGALSYMGYTVRTRPLRETTDEHGRSSRQARTDVEMATDLIVTAELYDLAVLVAAEGEFDRPAEWLRARGKGVLLVGLPEMTAPGLRNAADRFVDLAELRAEVEREGYRLPGEREGEPPAAREETPELPRTSFEAEVKS